MTDNAAEGLLVDVVRAATPTAGDYAYRGTVTCAGVATQVEATISGDRVALVWSDPGAEARFGRIVSALLRAATHAELTSHREPPRRIRRWRAVR